MYEILKQKINSANNEVSLKTSLLEFFCYIKISSKNTNNHASYRIDPAFANDSMGLFPSEIGIGLLAEKFIYIFEWELEIARRFSEDIQDVTLEVLTAHNLENQESLRHEIITKLAKLEDLLRIHNSNLDKFEN